jgi:hypothetical protein
MQKLKPKTEKQRLAAKAMAIKMYANTDTNKIVQATGLTKSQIVSYAHYAGVKRTIKAIRYPAYYQFATEILEKYPIVSNDLLAAEYGITPSQLQQFAFKHKVTKEGRKKLDYKALKDVELAAAEHANLLKANYLLPEFDVIKEDKPSELEAAGFFDIDKFAKQF